TEPRARVAPREHGLELAGQAPHERFDLQRMLAFAQGAEVGGAEHFARARGAALRGVLACRCGVAVAFVRHAGGASRAVPGLPALGALPSVGRKEPRVEQLIEALPFV